MFNDFPPLLQVHKSSTCEVYKLPIALIRLLCEQTMFIASIEVLILVYPLKRNGHPLSVAHG
jgi:hypothetical protein